MDDIQESRKGHLKGKKGEGEGADVTKAPKQWLKQLMPGARHLEHNSVVFVQPAFSAVQCSFTQHSVNCQGQA